MRCLLRGVSSKEDRQELLCNTYVAHAIELKTMVDAEIKRYLDNIFPYRQVAWLNSPHDALGDRTPARAIKDGDRDMVLAILRTESAGNWARGPNAADVDFKPASPDDATSE